MTDDQQNPWLAAAEEHKDKLDAARHRAASAEPPAVPPTAPTTAPIPPAVGGERPSRSGRFHSTRAQTAATPNPFLPAPTASLAGEADEEGEYATVKVTGPAAPTGAPAPADPLLKVPARFDHARAYPGLVVQVVGLHGGAGASTIAALLGREAIDCGAGLGHLVSSELPVVFVARTHAHGLQLGKRAAAQWASGGLDAVRVLGFVLVDDAPTLSKGLHREVKSLERAFPYSWRVAWSEDLRHSAEPPLEAASGRLRRIRKSLLSQATKLPRATARENTITTLTEGTA